MKKTCTNTSVFKLGNIKACHWGIYRISIHDSFMCRRCDGTIQETDLAEDLMVDGETYGRVKSFCYLGDILDGDGGADLAATSRIRNG